MNSKTLMCILKRILLAILTVWVVITVTFFVMRSVPGGPFLGEKAISEAAEAALMAQYGMDKPLMEQYFTYLKAVVTEFNFGPSLKLRGRNVIDVISGGMRQRVMIAMALACEPDILIADEPTTDLDVSIQAQVINMFDELQEQMNLTYLFIAHDLLVVRHISDRIAVMYLGRMVELTDSDEIYHHPLHPYTKSLMSAVPLPDPKNK